VTNRAPSSHPREDKPTILVVDDYPRNLRIVSETLTAHDYAVVTASSGASAITQAEAIPPDIVLLDLMMPVMDGLEVCRRLKSRAATKEIPIIFLTAAEEKKLVTTALELGAVDYIVKPFNPAELLARVRTHLELRQTRDELRRIIQQKNELMSVVAHDLKNPLATIRLSAQLLQEQPNPEPASFAKTINRIISACDDSLAFINARLENNAKEVAISQLSIGDVSLADVILLVVQQNHTAAAAKAIALNISGELAGVIVRADYFGLVQVIDNLVSNAIKFSPPGRPVEIGAARVNGESVRIEVRDQGPGLTPGDFDHLFEPFRRLSATPTAGESSTGLGLNIARRLVEAMRGEIGCDSVHGAGACFWATLPAQPKRI
jgi:two-component system sensor histidine kinase/response regulator